MMKKNLKNICSLMIMMSLFGLFFPEFMINPDTVKAYYIKEDGQREYKTLQEGRDLYEELLQAEDKEITIKFKFWEDLKQLWKRN